MERRSLKVWLTQTSEPYPFLPATQRMRTATLAAELVSRGHEVVWWGSNIEHRRKQPLEAGVHSIAPGYSVRLLPVPPYERNLSWRRYRGYKSLARDFTTEAKTLPPPDLVVAGLPVHDLAYAAVRFACERSIPSLVDVRDLWPDSFVDLLPRGLRTIGRAALMDDFRRARFALENATGIIGISKSYLDWALKHAKRPARETDGVCYLGSNPLGELRTTSSDPQWWPNEAQAVFGFLGVFGHTYDLRTVLAAARILWEAGDRRAHFVLAGTGDFAKEIALRAEGLGNVSLPGWLDAGEADMFLRRMDVGLASYAAGAPQSLPNKPFQYFSAGKAVISSLDGEFRDLLEEARAGLHYEAGDATSLIRAVRAMLDAPRERLSMAQRAGQLYQTSFNSELIYPKLADHLEWVAAVGHSAYRPALESDPTVRKRQAG